MNYLYDLKERENMILYYSLKNKHGYSLPNKMEVLNSIQQELNPILSSYDYVIIPESSSKFLEILAKNVGVPYCVLHKNSIEYMKNIATTLGLQKAELRSHLEHMNNMNGSFKISELKSTQRPKYIQHLFRTVKAPANTIILDDSNFTGTTQYALKYSTGLTNYFSLFSK